MLHGSCKWDERLFFKNSFLNPLAICDVYMRQLFTVYSDTLVTKGLRHWIAELLRVWA